MVATAMMSVSVDPPALAVCINRSASIHEPLRLRGALSVNVLSDFQQSISRDFARLKGEERFCAGSWLSYQGSRSELARLPVLDQAGSVFLGHVREQVVFGTHSLFIVAVDEMAGAKLKRPLIYCDGNYGSFAA